ncbi:SDR family oxidoreductase [Bradyrhizobium vignae]|uniref:SDR family oxidoreductase n=1 Tax=Bradyrhizobium vignae TaxID=1549949 RepID=UPI00100A553C|nr:SDR family oxidoreductase [Bradyrhizobium vignae]RXG99544.1 SDR family oxidoreductase [Bradyrhizobium vignae]
MAHHPSLTGMMELSTEQAEAVKQEERGKIPLARRGDPDEIADWIVRFASPASRWVTGQVLAVDGGLGLI